MAFQVMLLNDKERLNEYEMAFSEFPSTGSAGQEAEREQLIW